MTFGRVAAPYVGEYIPQWRRVRLPLIVGKRGEKWRGVEAIIGTWGGVGVREVLVLELRGVILIECLHTLILKIKN